MFSFWKSKTDETVAALREQIEYLKLQLETNKNESSATLKQQLDFANAEKKELMDTLIQLTRPNVIVPSGESKELVLAPQAQGTFSRRKAVLEQMHKQRDKVAQTSPFIAQVEQPRATVKDITPQSVESLEQELGVVDETGAKTNAS